jgi:predicted deacylase
MGLDILLKKESGYYGEDKKCILLIPGIHGIEVTSICAAKKRVKLIEENGYEKSVTIISVTNPIAFGCRTRRDTWDLNRIFPYQ